MRNQLILRAAVSAPKSRWTHSSEIDFKAPRKAVTAFSPHKAPKGTTQTLKSLLGANFAFCDFLLINVRLNTLEAR